MTNREKFIEAYSRNLVKAVTTRPLEYAFPVAHVPAVVNRIVDALDKGSVNVNSIAFKWTAKELGIKSTQKAIFAYWNGTL